MLPLFSTKRRYSMLQSLFLTTLILFTNADTFSQIRLASDCISPTIPTTSAATTTTATPTSSTISLRIMPLGDSITYGEHSSTGNGYREALLSLLLNTTSNTTSPPVPMFGNITYVGSQVSGNMTQPSNEGWPGYTISQIASKAFISLPICLPNLILLMAGTNDIVFNDSLSSAPDRLSALIGTCLTLSPNSVVVVAQLTPFADPERQAATVTYNSGVGDVVRTWRDKGAKVVAVNMQGPGGVEVGDLSDGEHPNDEGYGKMAEVWYGGAMQAVELGWIREPVQIGSGSQASTSPVVVSTTAVSSTNAAVARLKFSEHKDSIVMITTMLWWGVLLLLAR